MLQQVLVREVGRMQERGYWSWGSFGFLNWFKVFLVLLDIFFGCHFFLLSWGVGEVLGGGDGVKVLEVWGGVGGGGSGSHPPGFQIISHFPYVLTFLPFSFTVCGNIPPPWKTYKGAPISSFPVVRDIKTSMI